MNLKRKEIIWKKKKIKPAANLKTNKQQTKNKTKKDKKNKQIQPTTQHTPVYLK